jgi:hypothetical protein
MSDNGYWQKVNVNILNSLGNAIDLDEKEGRYLEAVTLQFCLMESELRYCILRKLERRRYNRELSKYYASEKTNFASLVDYLELLGGGPGLASSLRDYNASRVKIVHKIMFFSNIDELQKNARIAYDLGKKSLLLLVDEVNNDLRKLGYSTNEDIMLIAEKRGLLLKCRNCGHARILHIDTPNLKESDHGKGIEELSKACTAKDCKCSDFRAG